MRDSLKFPYAEADLHPPGLPCLPGGPHGYLQGTGPPGLGSPWCGGVALGPRARCHVPPPPDSPAGGWASHGGWRCAPCVDRALQQRGWGAHVREKPGAPTTFVSVLRTDRSPTGPAGRQPQPLLASSRQVPVPGRLTPAPAMRVGAGCRAELLTPAPQCPAQRRVWGSRSHTHCPRPGDNC